jgi:DNA-binding NarL/FixJ family response regulator
MISIHGTFNDLQLRQLLSCSGHWFIEKGADMEGSIYLDGKLPRPREQELDPLTLMEEKVLRLVSEWKTTKQIAFELELAESTEKHASEI